MHETLESLRNNFNLDALAITLPACAALVAIVALIARRTEDRPVRDTLALIGSGVVLVVLLMLIVIAFSGHDITTEDRWLLRQFEYILFLSLAFLVWWGGNKISRRARARKARRSTNQVSAS